jgi:arabinogalactan oligomer/maltooligosaccharide transport system substrate-binding protein
LLPPSPPAQRGKNRRAAFATGLTGLIAVLAPLQGCGPGLGPGDVIYGFVGIEQNQVSSIQQTQGLRRQLDRLQDDFRRLRPRTLLQLVFLPEDRLAEELVRRESSGLGPDLVLSNGDTAIDLAKRNLTRAVTMPDQVLHRLSPALLADFRADDGRIIALPVMTEPQLACFDRRRLPAAPRDTEELLTLSARGVQVGLAIEPVSLFWSSGSLGANNALAAATAGAPLSAGQRRAVVEWMGWLVNANLQQRVTFYANNAQLEEELGKGRADWIPCRSASLQNLRESLGDRLGVAPLPDGPQHRASPVNRLKAWSFGRNSSPRQRRTAEAFASFSTNPLVQRNLTIGSRANLPVNRFVQVPVQSSEELRVLVAAKEQANDSLSIASLVRGRPEVLSQAQDTISQLVFGELTPEQAASRFITILGRGR